MADTPWTKGPWTLWDGDIVAQSDACNPIVTLYDDTSDADARLIAAAPDIAEALEAVMQDVMSVDNDSCLSLEVGKAVKAALRKARGEQ